MPAKILSAAVIGLDAEIIEVEADIGQGDLGIFSIVGLPDAAVSESKERVRSAIKNSGELITRNKIIINLAPADLKKQGPSYDLPIAISLLIAMNKLKEDFFIKNKILIVGELALNGEVRSINGVLPIALKAKELGINSLFIPKANEQEACLVSGIDVYAVSSLKEIISHLKEEKLITKSSGYKFSFTNNVILQDMAHVNGQEQAKRALEIAASGSHNILAL